MFRYQLLLRHAFISDHKFSFYNPRLLEKASNKIVLIKEYSDAKSLKCNIQSLECKIC